MSEWIEREVPEGESARLVAAGRDPLLARLLASRGVTAETLEDYFDPRISKLPNPCSLPGLCTAAEEVLEALVRGCEIVIFGDYDCDGISATAILVRMLRAIGGPSARVGAFLPRRLEEGYGMTDASVARLLSEHPGVGFVVTVDNGINSVAHVARLKAQGIGVVVTDHHLPGETIPVCTVVNPKVAAPEPFANLCGAGVAFLLAWRMMAIARERGLYRGPNLGEPLIVLAGLATVTDLMPLTGPNRVLVVEALRRFANPARASSDEPMRGAPVGLKELHARAARTEQPLAARDFAFAIGPRINAAGRLSSGEDALELLLIDPEPGAAGEAVRERARVLSLTVDAYNVERKAVEQQMTEEAMKQIVPGATAQVIDLPGGHPGVAGIVAAHVLERVGGGLVCVSVDGHGSARAASGYNVRDALAASIGALERFGGHAAAAGFTLRDGALPLFRELFARACEEQRLSGGVTDTETIDAWVSPEDLTVDLALQLRKMEPFGEGNPEPKFALRSVRFASVRPIGADGKHLQFVLAGANPLRAVWWNHGPDFERLGKEPGPHDMLFCVGLSSYGGDHVELRVCSVQ